MTTPDMKKNTSELRKEHFSSHWLTWAALRHFLSAPMQRELCYVLVDKISNGRFTLDEIFDEVEPSGESPFSSWLIRAKESTQPLIGYLQHRLQKFAWQSDSDVAVMNEQFAPGDNAEGPTMLEEFIALGAADFTLPRSALESLSRTEQLSANTFRQAFLEAQELRTSLEPNEYALHLKSLLNELPAPLFSAILKHFGDLCADMDDWEKAQGLYAASSRKLDECREDEWTEFRSFFSAIIFQSQAAALRNIEGPASAASHFETAFEKATIADSPFFLANASWDASFALLTSDEGAQLRDVRRTIYLSPPLLHDSHSDASARASSHENDFAEANKRFWSVLRRQVALGSATESRLTKANYAESIINEINVTLKNRERSSSFQLAVRLLVESGISKAATRIKWNEDLVGLYVNQECVDFVIECSRAHDGVRAERSFVIIELFLRWCELLSPDEVDVATNMLRYLARLALEGKCSLYAQFNVGGRSLEALKAVAEHRPEFREAVSEPVALAAISKIRSPESWRGGVAALETAAAYLDTMAEPLLENVVRTTINMLQELGTGSGAWPFFRAAFLILLSEPVALYCQRYTTRGMEIASTILEFGLRQETEQATMLYYLKNFGPEILRETSHQEALKDAIIAVQQHAKNINSSNAIYNVNALLQASAVTGPSGIDTALNALGAILESVNSKHPSMNLAHAYSALLLLADGYADIASAIAVDPNEFRARISQMMPLICNVWTKAKDQPLLFSTFSIPPAERPNSTIVHNWAFASLQFAAAIGDGEAIASCMAEAAAVAAIGDAIALARVTRSVAKNSDDISFEGMRIESRDVFYAALGRRIAMLHGYDPGSARSHCLMLAEQCLRLGPRDIDSSVFVLALQLNLQNEFRAFDHSNYRRRLDRSPELRQNLEPVFTLLTNRDIAPSN